jgi:hypothetical protein
VETELAATSESQQGMGDPLKGDALSVARKGISVLCYSLSLLYTERARIHLIFNTFF